MKYYEGKENETIKNYTKDGIWYEIVYLNNESELGKICSLSFPKWWSISIDSCNLYDLKIEYTASKSGNNALFGVSKIENTYSLADSSVIKSLKVKIIGILL